MCCQPTKSSKAIHKVFSSRRVTRRQVWRYFTSNGIYQNQNGLSNLFIPYREPPRSTRIVVAYPRLAFSETKRSNHAPISFDQQAQFSQGYKSYRGKENGTTEVDVGGGLELSEVGARARIQPSKALCVPEKFPRILTVRRSFSAFVGRKHRSQRSAFRSEASRFKPSILTHRGSALP